MIDAELKRKIVEIENKEDVLTSNVFGLLSLLPNIILIKIMNSAKNRGEKTLEIGEDNLINIKLWERCEYGEPDVIVEGDRFVAIIEAKYLSGKSGSAYEDKATKEIKNEENDQLAKYWKYLAKWDNKKFVKFIIFLTNDPYMPVNDIKMSEDAALKMELLKPDIYWLNWTQIHYAVIDFLENDTVQLNKTDIRIIEKLHQYFNYKGFIHFMGWRQFDYLPNSLSIYKKEYFLNIVDCNISPIKIYQEVADG